MIKYGTVYRSYFREKREVVPLFIGALIDINNTTGWVDARTKPSVVAQMLGIDEQLYLEREAHYAGDFELGLTAPDRMQKILRDLDCHKQLPRVGELVRAEENETVKRANCYPGAIGVLHRLKALGLQVGHCSNGNPYGEAVAENLGLLRAADGAAFSYEIGSRKPAPALYKKALEEIEIPPEKASNVLFVGDGGDDELTGARALGMTTIQVRNHSGIQLVAADRHIGPIAELPLLIQSLLAAS